MRPVVTCGVVAFLVGTVAPARGQGETNEPPGVPLRVRVVEMNGLEWRGRAWAWLDLLENKGTTLVWATDARTLGGIVGGAATESTLATGERGDQATPSAHRFVAWLHRKADGPPGRATQIGFAPVVDKVVNGTDVAATGRRDGDGLTIKATVRDSRIIEVHTVVCKDTPRTPGSVAPIVAGSIQVPEVFTAAVDGTWRIEPGEALVISLGAFSVAGGQRERLVLIDGGDLDETAFQAGQASAPTAATPAVRKVSMVAYVVSRTPAGAVAAVMAFGCVTVFAWVVFRKRRFIARD
jgi:hypothetical protein